MKKAPARRSRGAHQRQVQVVAGSDMGWRQSIVVKDIGQQEIIHMTSMTRRIDDVVLRSRLLG